MQESNFRYLITSHFDRSGVEAAKAGAREVKNAADASATLAGASAHAAQFEKEAIARAKENAAATEKLTGAKQRLREAVRGAALQFPLLGRLAGAFVNPFIAAVGLVTFALHKLWRASEEYKQSLASSEWASYVDVQRASARATMDAALAAEEYQRRLDRLAESSRSVTEAIRAEVEALRARNSALGEVDDSEKDLRLAKVTAAEQSGQLNAEQALKARARIEDEYAKKRKQRADEEARAVLDLNEAELQALNFNIAQSEQAISKIQARLKQTQPPEVFAEMQEAELARITEAESQLAARQKQLETLQKPTSFWRFATGSASAEVRALPGAIEGDKRP